MRIIIKLRLIDNLYGIHIINNQYFAAGKALSVFDYGNRFTALFVTRLIVEYSRILLYVSRHGKAQNLINEIQFLIYN